jgi:VWFA-related protein
MLAGCAILHPAHHVYAQGTDITVTIDEVDASDFPTILARVSVRDRNGVPIPDLTTEHFEIVEDGSATFQPTTVDTESKAQAQVSLAIVIDMYRTLSGDPIEAAQQATTDLLTELLDEPNDPDRAAFVGVRQDVSTDPAEIDEEYEVPFTNDRNKLLNVISFLHERMEMSGPGTPLYDAAIKAIRLAAATEPVGHRAVIVMTDGEDVGSTSEDSDTIQSATNARTPVFTIGLSNSRLNEQYLKRLADQTGGTYQAAETPEDFSPLFSNVLTMLHTQYVLTYDSGLPQDGQTHSLLMHVRTPTQMEGYQEYRIEAPGTAAEPIIEEEATSTPAPPTPTPTPEPSDDNPLQEAVSTLQDWVQDNTLLAALVVAAIGLLFLGLMVVVIIAIRRRGRAEEGMPPPPEAPPYPAAAPPPFAETGPETGRATAHGAPGPIGAEITGGAAPSPTVAAESAPPFEPTPAGPFAGPAAPPPPFAEPGAQPPPAGATHILERKPKMSVVGLLVDRKHPERRFDIAKPTVTIGRTQSADVVIDHNTVSRQHATIKLEEGQFRLYDLGSTNGTFLGQQQVREPVTLEDGATVRFGEVECVFKIVSLDT